MLSDAEWLALAGSLDPVNGEIVSRAWFYYSGYPEPRDGLETAHNLITDSIRNLVVMKAAVPTDLLQLEEDLYNQRIMSYGAVGRPATLTPPYWKYGW